MTAKRDELLNELLAWQKSINAPLPTQRNPAYHPSALPVGKQKRGRKNRGSAGPDRAAMFPQKDKDNDGKLSLEEFNANKPDAAASTATFEKWDLKHDGSLSANEFVNMDAPHNPNPSCQTMIDDCSGTNSLSV